MKLNLIVTIPLYLSLVIECIAITKVTSMMEKLKFFQNKLTGLVDLHHISISSAIILSVSSLTCTPFSIADAAEARYGAMADVGVGQYLVKDGRQHMRLSIPSGKSMKFVSENSNDVTRSALESLELIRLRLEQVGFSFNAVWQGVSKDFLIADTILTKQRAGVLQDVNSPKEATELLDNVILPNMRQLFQAIKDKDITATNALQESTADALSKLMLMKLPAATLPYEIPSEYDDLPRLLGRATANFKIEHKGGFKLPDGKSTPSISFPVEVDGYHAPITAGNFIDLVNKKFYDGNILQSEELIIQTKLSPSQENQKEYQSLKSRKIPLEIFYKQDNKPTYGISSDDDNRALDTQSLPFQAYGALGMGRENDDPDSGTTDFFFLKWNQALIAPGRNTLDGYYSCFGYVTENEDFLKQIESGDKIISATVISGIENLKANK